MPERDAERARLFPAADYGNPDPRPQWMDVEWRAHLHRVELPGAEVVYAELGEGEPMLFVHGLGGCWQNWLETLPHFARDHRAIALDLPGFGASPMPTWEISMAAYGRLLHDFCERLGIEGVAALVGNSMGGFAATEAAIERPGRFERLVLVSAAGISFAEVEGRRSVAIARSINEAAPHIAAPRPTWFARPRGKQVAFGRVMREPRRLRPELLREQMTPGLGSEGFVDAVAAIVGYDTRQRLTEIEVPTLIVWGLNDRVVPVEAAVGYHRLIPHSRLEIFERTGHVPMLERPARFNKTLDEFLDHGLAGPADQGRSERGVLRT
jgi:pimeloyl-ACP methyl ester carboxylesterase